MTQNQWHALREMVQRWDEIVAQIERGNVLTFDDYLNDLDLRRLIGEAVRDRADIRSVRVPARITNMLSDADERFRAATVVTEENVWGAENAAAEGWSVEREWWYYRVPRGG